MIIKDLNITTPYCVYDIASGNYIFQNLDLKCGDIPPDIAILPVEGLRMVRSDSGDIMYIDVEVF